MTHLNTRTQHCGDAVQHVVGVPAFSVDLFEQVLSAENMRSAWARSTNKGAAGIDKMTIFDFPEWARANWTLVKAELWTGTYQPQPVRRVEIEKPDGGIRPLGIPNITDRVIQQAIAQVLTPNFDPEFSAHSYGYRPKRSAADAVKQIHGDMKQGRRIVVDIDLSKFFDRVNHDRLMSLLGQKVDDKRLLALIGRYLRAGVMVDQQIQPADWACRRRAVSPLLANIMLDRWTKNWKNAATSSPLC
jgi:RNA-directed DNA polymerase